MNCEHGLDSEDCYVCEFGEKPSQEQYEVWLMKRTYILRDTDVIQMTGKQLREYKSIVVRETEEAAKNAKKA